MVRDRFLNAPGGKKYFLILCKKYTFLYSIAESCMKRRSTMLMRRSHACLLLCLLLCSGVSGQLLTPVPAFPLDTSTVTIIVDATLGNQGLFNNTDTGGVYVYTGVTTGAGNWQDIPAACVWGTPNALVKATYLGNNKYSF